MPDLTTLTAVKQLGGNSGNSNAAMDAITQVLITSTSADFLRAIERPDLLSAEYTEIRTGDGSRRIILRHWPVTAVETLNISGTAVQAVSNSSTTGWYLDTAVDPERLFVLYLAGSTFADGAQIAISYTAGYVTPPADIAQAVAEWVVFRSAKRTLAGQTEQRSVEGERVNADPNAMPANTQRVIDRYLRKPPTYGRQPVGADLAPAAEQQPRHGGEGRR